MILDTKYQLSPETSVQPDGMIGEHRARENSQSSECDPSPRRAAVDTGSEESGTPPQSPAIGMGSEEPGAPFETSMDGFLNQNLTSTEQESALLHRKDVGVDDDEKVTTTTTQQTAVRKESVSPTEKLQQ